jgi:hypothetical protein
MRCPSGIPIPRQIMNLPQATNLIRKFIVLIFFTCAFSKWPSATQGKIRECRKTSRSTNLLKMSKPFSAARLLASDKERHSHCSSGHNLRGNICTVDGPSTICQQASNPTEIFGVNVAASYRACLAFCIGLKCPVLRTTCDEYYSQRPICATLLLDIDGVQLRWTPTCQPYVEFIRERIDRAPLSVEDPFHRQAFALFPSLNRSYFAPQIDCYFLPRVEPSFALFLFRSGFDV